MTKPICSREGEEQRLRVLQSFEILDTEEEAVFDDFTRLVSGLLDVPIALISLVDEGRQWFKSYVGLDVRQTDRDVAFCDHAIRQDQMLVVPDAREDERFRENPLVIDQPHIRFYAGAPLISAEGLALGTLCAIDTRPRDLSESQRETLSILARQVMTQLELRRVTLRALRADVERLELEAKLKERQRHESLAVLAGGVAHDFNNLLASILGHANLASMQLTPSSEALTSISKIELAAVRAAELTKQMLAYAGQGSCESVVVDLSALVQEMKHLLEASLSPKVVLSVDLADKGTRCLGDSTQLRQVLMNLLLNGADAIGAANGMIAVRTGLQRVSQEFVESSNTLEPMVPGDYTFIEVADAGAGMSESVRSKMFDPFFTTKEEGRGLGLAAVLGIVRSHGGSVVVYSEEGQGTTIRVLLPAVDAELPARIAGEPGGVGNGERLLVIDDEEHVRSVTAAVLEKLGFHVATANDGQAGLAHYLDHRDDVDLILMDMSMPVMDGPTALRELRRIDSEVPVILMSGLPKPATDVAGGSWSSFLTKPVPVDTLLAAVRDALRSTADAS